MPTLRKLSVMYLLCAGWFTVAIAFDHNPPLERASRNALNVTLAAVGTNVVRPGGQIAREGAQRVIAVLYPPTLPPKKIARATRPVPANAAPSRQARSTVPPPKSPVPNTPRQVATPPLVKAVPEVHVATVHTAPPSIQPPPLAPTAGTTETLSPAELVRVSARLKENLTHEMLQNFDLFLYVSKADKGPWSQRLYVLRKDAQDNLTLLYDWPASTGREKFEIAPDGTRQYSTTPRGYYELDPTRMYRDHFSGEWHESMPYAMFFNWENHGYQTGLAIHGAAGLEISQLGTRASAGCIRIAPENAQLLFGLIRAQYKGLAPRFAFDQRTATMSNDGVLMHDASGGLQKAPGYKVLVFIENYGGENVVAALF